MNTGRVPHLGVCPTHGKLAYTSRKHARRVIRSMREPGMREYRCAAIDGWWHVGHLPQVVRQGRFTANELWPAVAR